jgi:hypothetical protein
VTRSVFHGNTTVGVAVYDQATAVELVEVRVAGTLHGGLLEEQGVFGDGVYAADGAALSLESCILAGNKRSGGFFDAATGELIDCAVCNNKYGLAIQDSQVEWKSGNNIIQGNGKDVAVEPGLLPAPAPPVLPPIEEVLGRETP